MIASEFEYRHRFGMMAAVFVFAYAFYNLDHGNVVWEIVSWNTGLLEKKSMVRLVYAAAAVLGGIGAAIVTWAAAYRQSHDRRDQSERVAFSLGGPFRYVRNPHFLGHFFLLVGLGTFQSRLGFPAFLIGEAVLILRLIGREEMQLDQQHGERFRDYRRRVSRLLPSLRPQIVGEVQLPRWRQALADQAFQWGLVATLGAFAVTLSDPVGYGIAFATLLGLAFQKLCRTFRSRTEAIVP